ncbi:hypothetical protein [Rhizobium sullae]|uniref:hypothetical protein n=1 Tax=Rhizobium sullae TaxID=50338 RepID=UPI00104E85A5|nr:hypothetical protein [Rhizobium sullae]
MNEGTDLGVEVVFSNHVYTERTKYGETHHVLDHHGTKRSFDVDRDEMSKTLVAAVRSSITGNSLTHVSKSYGDADSNRGGRMDELSSAHTRHGHSPRHLSLDNP